MCFIFERWFKMDIKLGVMLTYAEDNEQDVYISLSKYSDKLNQLTIKEGIEFINDVVAEDLLNEPKLIEISNKVAKYYFTIDTDIYEELKSQPFKTLIKENNSMEGLLTGFDINNNDIVWFDLKFVLTIHSDYGDIYLGDFKII